MMRLIVMLLTLLFSMGSPEMGELGDFAHSSNAARTPTQTLIHYTDEAEVNGVSSGSVVGQYHFTQIIDSPKDSKVPKAIYNYFKMFDTGKWPTVKPCY